MKYINLFELITILLIVYVFIYLLRFDRTIKLNRRISKYTINISKTKTLSLGDKMLNTATNIKRKIINTLKKSNYFKYKAQKYEKYIHGNSTVDSSYEILSIKIIFSLLLGSFYTIDTIIKNNFNMFLLLIYLICGYYIYNLFLIIKEKRRCKLIEEDLLKAIIIMNNAFKSGYNITQSIKMVSKDLTGPISEEFTKILKDVNYGLELCDAFKRFYERVKIKDALLITTSLNLLNLTGGNLVGIFNSIEKSFTNQKRFKDELNAMTSSSKLVYYFLLVMPFIIVGGIYILNPEYFSPIFTSILGCISLLITMILYISYVFIIKRIIRVDIWKIVL